MKAVLSSASAEQYEALRQNAVTREPIFSADPLGAILVVKNGVAGWMRRWDQVFGTASPDTPSSLPHPTDEPRWRDELAMLLAEMTAPHLRSTSS
jgi:hypothetical protein